MKARSIGVLASRFRPAPHPMSLRAYWPGNCPSFWRNPSSWKIALAQAESSPLKPSPARRPMGTPCRDGRVRAIAVTSSRRSEIQTDIERWSQVARSAKIEAN